MNAVDVVSTRVRMASAMPFGVRSGLLAGGTFEDPENARIIYLAVGGLLLLAVVLGVGTWYWWRTSKVEHPALGPLEMMSTRSWRRGDFNSRAKDLEASRPANAIHEAELVADELDLDAIGKLEPAQFDDFSDLLPAAEAAAPVAAVAVVAAAAPPAEPSEPDASEPEASEPDGEAAEPAVVEPAVVEPAEAAAPVKQGLIVIDTAPPSVVAQQLTLDDAVEPPDDDVVDDDHFDPLLRLNITE